MANPAITNEEDVPEAELAEPEVPHKAWSGKRLVLMVILPALVVIGAGAGLTFSGVLSGLLGGKAEHAATVKAPGAPDVFFDLPQMLVNVNSQGSRATFLKITVSLQLSSKKDIPAIKKVLPVIIDNFQVYLRELRLDDLRGSAGIYRLREELLARVNAAVAPVKVRDVLFKEMLVQ